MLSISFLFTNCASILNSKQQKVTVNAIDKNSTIYVNGKKTIKSKSTVVKLDRDKAVKQIHVQTEGYKDIYYVHYQTKKSPLHIISWIPFGILLYPPFLDVGPKAYNYEKSASFKEKTIKLPLKTEGEKYLFVNSTSIDLKENDLTVKLIKRKNYNKNNTKKFKDLNKNEEDIKFDNSIFTNELNEILISYKYTDSTNTIFKSNQNSSFVSATVKKINVKNVYDYEAKTYMNFIESDIEIEWDFLDIYGQSLFKKIINATSGQFSINFFKDLTVKNSIKDAISSSFLSFINDKKVRDLLKVTDAKEIKMPTINISNGQNVSNLEEALNSTITIKTKKGHGSGFAISNDGYILTNFHVIANEDEKDLIAIDASGKEFNVKVIRKNENYDLALLKIEKNFERHFKLSDEKNYSIISNSYIIFKLQCQ